MSRTCWTWMAALALLGLGLGPGAVGATFAAPSAAGRTAPPPMGAKADSSEEPWSDPRAAPAAGWSDPRAAPATQDGDPDNPNSPSFWSAIQAQGSKWVMDTVIVGASASLLSSASGIVVLAAGSSGFIFRTPRELTIDLDGLPLGSPRGIAGVISQFALAVIVVVGVYRFAGIITDYDPQALLRLAVQAALATALTLGSWELCSIMINVANVLADNVTANAFGGRLPLFQAPEVPSGGGVSLVYSFAAFLHYIALLFFLLEVFRRIILVNLLLCVSPLIGVAALSDGGWNYARVWLFRMVEALTTPILWAIALGVNQAIIAAWLQAGPGDALQRAVMALLLAAFAYVTVGAAPKMVGLASTEAVIGRASEWIGRGAIRISSWAVRSSTLVNARGRGSGEGSGANG